ncbi:MAG: hypothetical protein HGB14_13200 [Anaerolineaceae bacterium]|nr:hypothetical protein [Anaerolineaceae bacterium]
MTGIEAAKIISNMNSSIPILGFTAFAEDDIRSLKSQNLFKGFIFKPVDVPALLSLLRSLFS